MKKIRISFMVAGLLLLAACGPDISTGPDSITGGLFTATPVAKPTCTPTVTPMPAATETPAPVLQITNTPVPSPTAAPTVIPTVVPTATPVPTSTPVPTKVPDATPTAAPTAAPTPAEPQPSEVPEVTVTPEPTSMPEVSPTPVPTAAPTATPTPAINSEELVYQGWQKTESVLGDYIILFPEIFRECETERTDRMLRLLYQCEEHEKIAFQISYHMGQTLEETVTELLETGGMLVEDTLEEQKAVCLWQKDGMLYRGVCVEAEYPQTLLGTDFSEQESVTGVMQVIYSYPAEQQEQYETAEYSYYVIEHREE